MEQRPPDCDNCIVPLAVEHVIAEFSGNTNLEEREIVCENPERKVELNELF